MLPMLLPGFMDILEEKAIELLRENEPPQGYHGCFSGGKDSIVIKHLAEKAGVKATWHYNVTTLDPPELIYFMKKHHGDVVWVRPKHGPFFRRAVKIGFPTRKNRWCCREYKEGEMPDGVFAIMGIRKEESASRKERYGEVSAHYRANSKVLCPIYHWDSQELWEYIHQEKIPYCVLYDEGFHRIGCVGCPMSRKERDIHFTRWPKYEQKWRKMFHNLWAHRTGSIWQEKKWFGDRYFKNADEMFEWWVSDKPLPPPT